MEPVFRKVENQPGLFNFWCEGCGCAHGVWTESPNHTTNAKWDFNGDLVSPTISPSLLVRYPHPLGYSNDNPAPLGYTGPDTIDICHSFIRNGMIEYLSDCTHQLAGKTVPLKPF